LKAGSRLLSIAWREEASVLPLPDQLPSSPSGPRSYHLSLLEQGLHPHAFFHQSYGAIRPAHRAHARGSRF